MTTTNEIPKFIIFLGGSNSIDFEPELITDRDEALRRFYEVASDLKSMTEDLDDMHWRNGNKEGLDCQLIYRDSIPSELMAEINEHGIENQDVLTEIKDDYWTNGQIIIETQTEMSVYEKTSDSSKWEILMTIKK